jgi:hypothetical protein
MLDGSGKTNKEWGKPSSITVEDIRGTDMTCALKRYNIHRLGETRRARGILNKCID